MKIGYARISTQDQNTQAQIAALEKKAVWFGISGKPFNNYAFAGER